MTLKPDEIFFSIYDDMRRVYDSPNDAYDAAEEYFSGQTTKGFNKPYRKYSSFEVFKAAYERKKIKNQKLNQS